MTAPRVLPSPPAPPLAAPSLVAPPEGARPTDGARAVEGARPTEALVAAVVRGCAGGLGRPEAISAVLGVLGRALGVTEVRLWWADGVGLRPGPGWRVGGGITGGFVPGEAAAFTRVPVQSGGEPVAVLELAHRAGEAGVPVVLGESVRLAVDVLGMALVAERARAGREDIEERLVHTARLAGLGEVAACVIHDLSQPLLVIQAYLELVTAEGAASELQKGAFPVMGRAADRLLGLVRHLRTYTRQEPTEAMPFELRETASLARELCAGAMRESVVVEGDRSVIVRGDSARMEQVVVNLVTNALQAGGAPVVVRVARQEDGPRAGWARLDVVDRGPGVSEALRQRVFEPFFTTRARGQGTGLGLSICDRIVREHGGEIELLSPSEGGACFRVWLPALG